VFFFNKKIRLPDGCSKNSCLKSGFVLPERFKKTIFRSVPVKDEKKGGDMDSGSKFLTIASVVIIAVILQGIFIVADKKETPDKAAAEFAKAYFLLDKSMAKYLCSELTGDEENDVVDDYINRVGDEARASGFDLSYMRSRLLELRTNTRMVDDSTAEVHITAERERAINPVYALVGRLFRLIEARPVDATLTVIREKGHWKVCGQPFSLTVEES
jgi:hypothetical protein